MNRDLINRLFVPLLILVIISAGLHIWLEWEGFFLNLVAELIGIIITVAYVDYVLRRHEARRWRGVEARMHSRLQNFIIGVVAACRIVFGYPHDLLNSERLYESDLDTFREEIDRVVKEVLEPTALSRVEALDREGWQGLDTNMSLAYSRAHQLLITFNEKLKPKQYTLLLEIQDEIKNMQSRYISFPDIIGVPDDELPTGTNPIALKEQINYETAEHLRELLRMVRELTASLQDVED